ERPPLALPALVVFEHDRGQPFARVPLKVLDADPILGLRDVGNGLVLQRLSGIAHPGDGSRRYTPSTREHGRGADGMFYWLMKFIFLGPLLRLLFRPKAVGLENVPAEGPALIAANHVSPLDTVLLPL